MACGERAVPPARAAPKQTADQTPGVNAFLCRSRLFSRSDLGGSVSAPAAAPAADNPARQDAIAALAVLGYSMPEINRAIQSIPIDGLSTEQIVKAVLRQMMQ